MKKTFYKTQTGKTDHTRFGGIIYASDFNTNFTYGNIAERIISDGRFDERCKNNLINAQTLEEKENSPE